MKQIDLTRTPDTFILPVRDYLAAYQARSTEEVRYYLRGVYCETAITGGAWMVATDGTLMHYISLDSAAHIGDNVATQKDSHYGGFILDMDPTEKAMKAKGRGALWMHGDISTGIVQVFDTSPEEAIAERVGVCEFGRIDGTFPDWRRIRPNEDFAPDGAFALDLDVIEKTRKACRLYERSAKVSFHSGRNPADPVLIKSLAHPAFSAVAMPVRM